MGELITQLHYVFCNCCISVVSHNQILSHMQDLIACSISTHTGAYTAGNKALYMRTRTTAYQDKMLLNFQVIGMHLSSLGYPSFKLLMQLSAMELNQRNMIISP